MQNEGFDWNYSGRAYDINQWIQPAGSVLSEPISVTQDRGNDRGYPAQESAAKMNMCIHQIKLLQT